MTNKCVLTKTYRWMVISDDGLLKTPRYEWGEFSGEKIFSRSYLTEEDAVADYQSLIDKDMDYPSEMVLIPGYSVDHVF